MRVASDFVGVAVVGAVIGVLAMVVPGSQVPPLQWEVLFGLLSVGALIYWRLRSSPQEPAEWLNLLCKFAVLEVVMAIVGYALMQVVVPAYPIALIVVLLLIPSVIVVALAGLARSAFQRWVTHA